MRSFCPRCGAELPVDFLGRWFETSPQCSDCGVAPVEAPTVLPLSDDDVTYTLGDLAPANRSAITAALAEGGIAYRWEADQVLAVAGGTEREVDRVLEDFRSAEPGQEAGAAEADLGDGPGSEELGDGDGDGDDDGEGEGDGEGDGEGEGDGDGEGEGDGDGGEEATEAMSDLFVAADRLMHAPYDEAVGIDLTAAAATADACLPPYGIEMAVWRKVQDLANGVLSDLEQATDEDVVAADARALRDFLRNYV